MPEKFNISDVANLRNVLIQGGLDYMQSAELLQVFLMGHGFGVSPDAARDAASRVGSAGCSLEVIRKELEHLALVM